LVTENPGKDKLCPDFLFYLFCVSGIQIIRDAEHKSAAGAGLALHFNIACMLLYKLVAQ